MGGLVPCSIAAYQTRYVHSNKPAAVTTRLSLLFCLIWVLAVLCGVDGQVRFGLNRGL
jgi:hypothetical protein